MAQRGASTRIVEFLQAHPNTKVTVAVGYASVKGIAWLADQTLGRRVTLVIGDCRPRYFANATDSDRRVAAAFLRRDDVEVKNWYRRRGGASAAHLKAWVVHTSPPTVLTGSANLTGAGLFDNREVMAEVGHHDRYSVVESVELLTRDAWDYKQKLIRLVVGSPPPRPPRPPVTRTTTTRSRTAPPPQARQHSPELGPSPADPGSFAPDPIKSSPLGTRGRPATSQPAAGQIGKRRGCARIAKGCATFVALALVLFVVLVVALSRGCGDGSNTPTSVMRTTTAASSTTDASIHRTVADVTTVVVSAVSTTVPEGAPVVLLPLAVAYAEAMAGFPDRVDDLVREMNSLNRIWDAREEGSDIYSEIEGALVAVTEQTRALADAVRYQRVPIPLRGRHGEPGGPLSLAISLADLAGAVLDGLRVPTPSDGSERRSALQAFNEVAADFNASVERVLRNIEAYAQPGGILTVRGQTTTTRPRPVVELVDEAVAYVEDLSGFTELVDEILAKANAVNEAWDNRAETEATYSETETRLEEVAERAQEFFEHVNDHPVPDPVRGLGEGPKRAAPRIAEKAREVLAGLRIPAPNTGFERLAALDDLNAAARAFHASVNHVVSEVYAKAHTSGLAAGT